MVAVTQERPYSRFRFLPRAESVSGTQPVLQVINTNTSDAYSVLYYDEVLVGLVGAMASLFVSSGTIAAYSLTVPTSTAREEYDPAMVEALFRADADKPEATFTNVIDMMDWLERD